MLRMVTYACTSTDTLYCQGDVEYTVCSFNACTTCCQLYDMNRALWSNLWTRLEWLTTSNSKLDNVCGRQYGSSNNKVASLLHLHLHIGWLTFEASIKYNHFSLVIHGIHSMNYGSASTHTNIDNHQRYLREGPVSG